MTTSSIDNRLAPSRALRAGTMLAELVIAIAVSAILLLGIQSALSIALRSVPDPRSGAASTLKANRIVDQLVTELETAVFITDRSATSIGFTVPDRNGDGVNERIRYQWTGTAGGKLTRQYNGGAADTIAEQVDLFNLTPTATSVSDTYPLLGVEDSSESLLFDHYSTSGLGNLDVTATNWVGQHFTVTLPPGAVSWRPTRVQFMSKKASLLGTTLVQLRPATSTFAPSSTILEQFSLLESLLGVSYSWQSFDLTQVGGLPSDASLALVLQRTAGAKSLTVQSTNGFGGLERSPDGASWNYDSGKSLVSRLYGKLTRSSGEGSISTHYLTSMDVVLRMADSSPTIRTAAALLNHPELLTGKWEVNFDKNPTALEINGDGAADWAVVGGGAFDMTSITSGVWRTSGMQLITNPDCDFAKTTIVDLEFQSLTTGGRGAVFSMNALRAGSNCAPVMVSLVKTSDNTQTLSVQTKLNDSQTVTLIRVPGLPNQPVKLHLIVHPENSSISVKANDVQHGTYTLTPFPSTDSSRAAMIGADGGTAEFSYAAIRVLED